MNNAAQPLRTLICVLLVLAAFAVPSVVSAQSVACRKVNGFSGTFVVDALGRETTKIKDTWEGRFAHGETITYAWSGNTRGARVSILYSQDHANDGDGPVRDSRAESGRGSLTIDWTSADTFSRDTFTARLAGGQRGTSGSPSSWNSNVEFTLSCSAPPLTVSIDDVRIPEGDAGVTRGFATLTLSRPSDRDVSVNYVLADGTATEADADYVAQSGTLTFSPYQMHRELSFLVLGDERAEADETLFVSLSAPVNATIADGQGLLTIVNDDIPPTITKITPAGGPTAGGILVHVIGSGFWRGFGISGVRFGAAHVTSYLVLSDTLMYVEAPPGAPGPVDVVITNAAGGSANSSASRFTYAATPSVTALAPDRGASGGGSLVVLTGTGFRSAPPTGAVSFGAASATYNIDSDTQITATAPAIASGTCNITVTTPGGTSATSAANQFTAIAPPTVTDVWSNASPVNGGATVIITGTGFMAAASTGAVKFGAANARYTIDSDTQITAISPPNAAGTYDVTVTTAGGTSATSPAGRITYVAEPTVTELSPNVGSTLGRNTVILTGTGFRGATRVVFGETGAWAYTINSDTQITAMAPAGAADDVDVRVTTDGGTSVPSTASRYTYVAAPTVTSMSRSEYAIAGGDEVTITGSGFLAAAPTGAVKFGPASATYTIGSDTLILARSPANAAGTYDGTVTTPGGISATGAESRVTYFAAPTADSVGYNWVIPYNAGDNTVTVIDVATAARVRNSPTAFAVADSRTAEGGTVSINDSGQASYTPPAGFRNATDGFIFTASNAGGTSLSTMFTVSVGAPSVSIALPAETARVGEPFNSAGAAVTVSGGHGPYRSFSATGLPAGLSMNASGVISGTPTTAATSPVTVTVVDSSTGAGPYTASVMAEMTVSLPLISLSPAPGALPGARAGVPYRQTITSSGGYGTVVLSAAEGGLPPGIALSSDGLLSGTPTATGAFDFAVTATDSSGNGYSTRGIYSLTVTAPLVVIETATLPGGVVNAPYREVLVASGGTAPYAFQLVAGTLPAVLSLSTDGVLSGTPAQAGAFPIIVRATDATGGGGFAADVSYVLNIEAGAQTIRFGALPAASLSDSLLILSATASSGLRIEFVSGTPAICAVSGASLTLLQTGTCTIRADQAGDADWTAAPSVSQSFTVTPATLTMTTRVATGLQVGAAFRQTNSAAGGVAPYTYSLPSGALAPGVSLDAATGEVSGTPTVAGRFSYIIRATDARSVFVDAGVTIVTIAKGSQTVSFTSPPPSATLPGPDYTVTASSTSGLPVVFSLDASSSGCVLNGATLSFNAVGDCVINAHQAGDSNWTAAAQVQQRIAIVATPPITGDVSAVAVPYNSSGTPIDLSGVIRGGAHTAIMIGSPPAHGLVTVAGDVVTYTPVAGYFGPDSFTYTATGAGGTSSPSTVSLMVATPAAPTVSGPPVVAVPYNSAGRQIDLSSSVSGVYSSLSVRSGPAHGTASVSGDRVTYTPTAGYYGPDSFTFTATGPGGTSSSATVALTVATPPPPVVTPPTTPTTTPPVTAGGDGSVAITLGPLSSGVIEGYRIETGPLYGTAVIVISAAQATATGAGGSQAALEDIRLVYTPAANFMGTDTVSVVAYGPGGDSSPAAFTFQAAGTAPNLSGSAPSNGSITFSPTAGLVGGPFNAVRIITPPAFGTASVNGLDIVFAPGIANGGATSLTYVIDLPFGSSQAGTISLTSNLVPQAQALTATTLQGRPVTVRISDAPGGPFNAASVVSISPTTAGTPRSLAAGPTGP